MRNMIKIKSNRPYMYYIIVFNNNLEFRSDFCFNKYNSYRMLTIYKKFKSINYKYLSVPYIYKKRDNSKYSFAVHFHVT